MMVEGNRKGDLEDGRSIFVMLPAVGEHISPGL